MSKSIKCADFFTIANIQEDKEVLGEVEPETIRPEDISSLIGKTGTFRQHYPHTDYDSTTQERQNDD